MDSISLEFEPGSILTVQDLCATDVTTSRLPKKLGHLVEVYGSWVMRDEEGRKKDNKIKIFMFVLLGFWVE